MINEEKLNLIEYLRTYCRTHNIYFIPGPEDYQNAVMDMNVYKDFDLILVCDLRFKPIFSNAMLDSVQYNGVISIGRKKEIQEHGCNTVSTLDETFEQKYDRRLRELSALFVQLLSEIECNYDATIDDVQMQYSLNQYDLNADFISADIQITL